MIKLVQDGTEITSKMPSIHQLDGILSRLRDVMEYKKLAKSCVEDPPFDVLMKARPASGPAIGKALVEASGLLETAYAIDEDDLTEEQAAAVHEAEKRNFKGVVCCRVTVGGYERWFVQRSPREADCDQYLKSESVAAAKNLVEVITTHPARAELDTLLQEAPGLYHVLARFAMQRAGFDEAALLGE